MNRRGQVRLGALIAAGLVLGGTNASASPIEDNHNITVTDGSQRAVYGGNAELRHDNGDGTASASSNTLTVRSNDELGFLAGGWVEYQRRARPRSRRAGTPSRSRRGRRLISTAATSASIVRREVPSPIGPMRIQFSLTRGARRSATSTAHTLSRRLRVQAHPLPPRQRGTA